MHHLLEYFQVNDLREIRNSKRFKEEIEPHFEEEITLFEGGHRDTVNKFLCVVGKWKRDNNNKTGVYHYCTDGPGKGHWLVAQITF